VTDNGFTDQVMTLIADKRRQRRRLLGLTLVTSALSVMTCLYYWGFNLNWLMFQWDEPGQWVMTSVLLGSAVMVIYLMHNENLINL
jgi:Mg2+ and Co2+ transporter CorA